MLYYNIVITSLLAEHLKQSLSIFTFLSSSIIYREIVSVKPNTGLYIANCPYHVSRCFFINKLKLRNVIPFIAVLTRMPGHP